jgi:enoyl-CoA hydratase/carnithine racemase
VRTERRGGIAVWTLDRPQARNALDAATFVDLQKAVHEASADPSVRAVVLTGDGAVFAAGGDLRELRRAMEPGDAERLAELGKLTCEGIATLEVPVIAALPGPAIGGGAELAMACDLRVAAPGASLCFKHAHMGVTTAWGILPRLVAIAGHGGASRALLTGQTIGAAECLRMGLVDAVSGEEPGACLVLAESWARDVERGSPGAIAGMKALLREAAASERLHALERRHFVETWTSADHRDAVEAFFEKRAPRWTGK